LLVLSFIQSPFFRHVVEFWREKFGHVFLKAKAGAWGPMMRDRDAHKTLNEYICVEYNFSP